MSATPVPVRTDRRVNASRCPGRRARPRKRCPGHAALMTDADMLLPYAKYLRTDATVAARAGRFLGAAAAPSRLRFAAMASAPAEAALSVLPSQEEVLLRETVAGICAGFGQDYMRRKRDAEE